MLRATEKKGSRAAGDSTASSIDAIVAPQAEPEEELPARVGVGAAGASLDLWSVSPGARHDQVGRWLAAVAAGEALVIVTDHDPLRLRGQVSAERPGQLEWEPLEHGPELWPVRIGRSAAVSGEPSR